MNIKGDHSEDIHYRIWQLLTQPSQDRIAWVSQPKLSCHGSISSDLDPLKPKLLPDENGLGGFQSAGPLLGTRLLGSPVTSQWGVGKGDLRG